MKTLLSFIFGLVTLNAFAQSPILRGPGTTNTPAAWTNAVRAISTNSLSHASKLTPGGVLPPLDGAALTNLPSSVTGAQTNQFTTNVVGQPVLGRILLGSTGSIGADFQLRSTNTMTSVNFGDQALENRFFLSSSAINGTTSFILRSSNSTTIQISANTSPGTGGSVFLSAEPTQNALLFTVRPLSIQDAGGNEFAKFNQGGGLEHLIGTNIAFLSPLVTVSNNLNVGGTIGTAIAQGFDSPTNLWVANTVFNLGTNYVISQGAGTVGITGIANKSTTTERYGQLVILATGTVIFTNVAGIKCNDGLLTRTITNGNSATIAIDFVPGVVTNLFIVQTW